MDKFLPKLVEYPSAFHDQVDTNLNSSHGATPSSSPPEHSDDPRDNFDSTTRRCTTITPGADPNHIQHNGHLVLGFMPQQSTAAVGVGPSCYASDLHASTCSEGSEFPHLRSDDSGGHEMNPALFRLGESFELGSRALRRSAAQIDLWHDNQGGYQAGHEQWDQELSPQELATEKPELIRTDYSNILDQIVGLQGNRSRHLSSSTTTLGGTGDQISSSNHWAPNLLLECARAIAASDTLRVQNLMWALNELASPYGDCDQRLATYLLQALFCRVMGTGAQCHGILCAAAEQSYSFESLRNMILTFQEASPWTTFGHVAANGAMMEAFEGERNIHIVDISSTFCTQWPTLLEALATRAEGTPNLLRLTTIVLSKEESAMKVMRQIMTRLERFARLMGVPFESTLMQKSQLETLELAELNLKQDEALAINCIHTLHHVSESTTALLTPDARAAGAAQCNTISPRDLVLHTFKNANPKIITIVEDEVDLVSSNFMTGFSEALRYYFILFESLEESFPRASNERLMLERTCARKMINLFACDDSSQIEERQESGSQWATRLQRLGLLPAPFSDDVVDDVRALLKRYKDGWGLKSHDSRLFLTWKDQAIIFASSWKPNPPAAARNRAAATTEGAATPDEFYV